MLLPSSIEITTRAGKGSELTWNEGDANFENLETAVLAISTFLRANRVQIGVEPAAGERTGVAWIPTDNSGLFRYISSAWARVKEPTFYGTATGAANVYTTTISVPTGEWANLAALQGVSIKLKIVGSNTGPATLAVNGFAATAFKKFDTDDLVADDLPNGGVVEVVYDGTHFKLISATKTPTLTVDDVYGALPAPLSAGCPAKGTAAALPHTLGRKPIILSAVLVCNSATGGNVEGDEVCIHGTDSSDTNGGWSLFNFSADDDYVYVALSDRNTAAQDFILCKNANGSVLFVPADWDVKVYIL